MFAQLFIRSSHELAVPENQPPACPAGVVPTEVFHVVTDRVL
jgi:hypothetical protein